MRTTRHGDYLIQMTRFPRFFPINTYLVQEDDGFTLVDTGLRGAAPAMLQIAREHGAPIRRILLTHAHGDHVGSVDALHAALPEAEVLITGRDARFLRGDRSSVPGEPEAKPRGNYPKIDTLPTREIAPGDRIGSLEVVAAPGHTPGLVAFLDTRDQTLIAGDAFQTQGGIAVSGVLRPLFPFLVLATWHKPTAFASARTLRSLNPSRLAVGHGPVLAEPLSAMDRAIAEAERKFT